MVPGAASQNSGNRLKYGDILECDFADTNE